jgi:hypothetical protein
LICWYTAYQFWWGFIAGPSHGGTLFGAGNADQAGKKEKGYGKAVFHFFLKIKMLLEY